MADFDPRVTPARADLAAAHLKSRFAAPRYARGVRREMLAPSAPLRHVPRPDAPQASEILFGEIFTVYDEEEGWAWGQAALDDYVGYVPAQALGEAGASPTHTVAALRAHLYRVPDIKAPAVALLGMNAKLRIAGKQGKFGACDFEGGTAYAVTSHLAAVNDDAADFVAVAEAFVGTPYLWGGKQSLGLDCSGLVQVALERAGIAAPRDTDMQEAALGRALPDPADPGRLRRGDLVFWKGHVAIMVDAARMIHANATAMAVSVDPVKSFARFVEDIAGPVTSVKRLG